MIVQHRHFNDKNKMENICHIQSLWNFNKTDQPLEMFHSNRWIDYTSGNTSKKTWIFSTNIFGWDPSIVVQQELYIQNQLDSSYITT